MEGEPLRYEQRTEGAAQDWLKLPVSGISWDDARAYTRWLATTGRVRGARLCSEIEWERAARGADDREFPHGDVLQPSDANFEETYGRKYAASGPDAVGSHPASTSPFGVEDLSGNVWEWTSSVEAGHPIVRGGGANFNDLSCRAVNRELVEPEFRGAILGLRVCADLL
jgi:formylglycine-generating enzyme required for sulfatase activity